MRVLILLILLILLSGCAAPRPACSVYKEDVCVVASAESPIFDKDGFRK